MSEKLQEFIDLKIFTPRRIINPDSVVFRRPIFTFHTYFTVNLHFRMLDGRDFQGNARGFRNNLNRVYITINNEKQNLDKLNYKRLLSFDAQAILTNGKKVNYYFYEFDGNSLEELDNSQYSDIVLKENVLGNQIAFEDILKASDSFIKVINDIGYSSSISETMPEIVKNLNWKLRWREQNRNLEKRLYYTPSYYEGERFTSSNMNNLDNTRIPISSINNIIDKELVNTSLWINNILNI